MTIFQKSVINKYLNNLDQNLIETSYQAFKDNYTSAKIDKIKRMKEEEYQDGFLRDLFVSALGYTLKPDDNFNLVREFKNLTDGKKADGAILKDGMAIAVIELKSAKTKELKSITGQAFGYKNNQPECKYVITSNFHKLRFYIDCSNEFVEFNLFDLSKENFNILYLVLSKDSVFADTPLKLKEDTAYQEENISKQFYKDYSNFKNKLFENLIKNNPEYDKLTLFKKSQKLIDRFLFILFAEDRGLLQPNLINRIIQRYKILEELDFKQPLYDIFKQFFGYLNTGREKAKSTDAIPAYNGGLFRPDETLDRIIIDDETLLTDLPKLSSYDFNTELDVDILGHIFEHSLSEIEEITAELEGVPADKAKSKRKKDGVFYTPKYITQYIVENTIGRLCTEKRDESELNDIEIDDTCYLKSGKLSEKGKKLYSKIETYKSWLLSLKIVDPACGSGAFLNQALNFLIDEHRFIIDLQTELKKGQIALFNIEAAVLENNLYGVDINEESVEIAKLSLWLRTARKGRKLTDLSNNIKCGNSLIDDPEIAGERAFKWEDEFSEIMESGGFDVVVGNPPYVSHDRIDNKNFLSSKYNCFSAFTDLYSFFYELGLKLIKDNGLLFFITSNSFLKAEYGKNLRKEIIDNSNILSIINIEQTQLFGGAIVNTVLLGLKKSRIKNQSNMAVIVNKVYDNKIEDFYSFVCNNKFECIQQYFTQNSWSLHLPKYENLKSKIRGNFKTLENYNTKIRLGIATGANNVFVIDKNLRERLIKEDERNKNIIKPIIRGRDIDKFYYNFQDLFILLTRNEINVIKEYPTVYNYLDSFDDKFKNRGAKGKHWSNLRACSFFDDFKLEKIVWIELTDKPRFTLITEEIYLLNSAYFILSPKEFNSKFLLPILNSKVIHFYLKLIANTSGMGTTRWINVYVKEFPIPFLDFGQQQPFIEKADLMLDLNKQLQTEKNNFLNTLKEEKGIEKISKKVAAFYDLKYDEFKKELRKKKVKIQLGSKNNEWRAYFNTAKQKIKEIESLINNTAREIDQMVYRLYDLTDEEIKIVESET
jgi:hypothetical protein